MRKCLFAAAVFALGLLCGAVLTGSRLSAAEAKKNFDLDVVEMDRTRDLLIARVNGINEALKGIAREVTAANLADPEKQREKKIQQTLVPLQEDAIVLFVQTFLLAVDSVVDTGGAQTEGFFLGELSKRLDVPIKDLVDRREKSNLGLGGVALGYAIAKAAKLPADEIFANKADNKSWPEVMRFRNVTVPQLQAVLENKE